MPAMTGRGGPWTEQKLKALGGYLRAFNTALKRKHFERIYVDAFAGSGDRKLPDLPLLDDDPEIAGLAKGSVRIALECEPTFHRYMFIEKSDRHVRELRSIARQYPERSIDVHRDDANKKLLEICRSWDKRNWRGVLFVDPYGCQVECPALQAVAATQSIDVWLLFPVNAVRRMLPRHGHFEKGWRERLTTLFGSEEWFSHFYPKVADRDLLGHSPVERRVSLDRIENLYRVSLLRIFHGGVCERPLRLGPRARDPLYSLFFACGNPSPTARKVAFSIANHILKAR